MMSKSPAISIIIPIYNVEKYLRRCLDSVLNQTFTDWQAICVNDGSPDGSASILSEYAARDKRFVIVNKENGGLSDARNAGLPHATGEYILYLDSDDFIHPQTMEIVMYFARAKDADMVLFGYDVKFYRKTHALMRIGFDVSQKMPGISDVVYKTEQIKFATTSRVLMHCTERNHGIRCRHPVRRHCFPVMGLYRREMIKDLLFIPGIIMEDFPWWSAVMLRARCTVMIKTPLYFYMPNPASILNSSAAMRMVESIAVGLKYVSDEYQKNADAHQWNYYNREFFWPFIIIMMRKIFMSLDSHRQKEAAKVIITRLSNDGIFNNPPNWRARKYRRRIAKFIKI